MNDNLDKYGASSRKTMFEFQEARIDALQKTNEEYYEKIKDLTKLNDDLSKILIDVLDNDCQDHFKEVARSFIFNSMNNVSDD